MSDRSGVSWLSSSSAEIARARHILKSLTPGGTIDELGFLVLQGAFADVFYPAVTTPMTRARYFVFVPAIYRYLEESGKALGKDADRLARDKQFELLESVRDEDGAIGKESGRAIVRPPAEIYWNALGVLGLASQRVSLAAYHRRLSDGVFRATILKDDDKVAHAEDAESLWDLRLRISHVIPGGVFPATNSMRLRRSEAELLRKRYAALRPDGHDCLITHLVAMAERQGVAELESIEHAWDVPGLPPNTRQVTAHARRLSLFARGATLQYHRMLIEKKGEEDTGAAEAFTAWWEFARDDLAAWDLDDFFSHIQRWDANRRPLHDREFLNRWRERCLGARSAAAALDDKSMRAIIQLREDRVRPGKQRLRVRYQLDSWQMLPSYRADVHYQLAYRHPVGRRFAEDIADGLLQGGS